MKHSIRLLLFISALSFSVVAIGKGASADEVAVQNGHEYVCTGIGKRARTDPRWSAFPLKLMFANRRGEYLSDVSVALADGAGKALIEVHCNGPWLLVKLNPGPYKARVTDNAGQVKTVTVTVPASGQTQVVVRFDRG